MSENLEYLRQWGTRIAEERHEFISCLCQSLKSGDISISEALYAMGYAGLEVNDVVLGTIHLYANMAQRESVA